MGILKSFKYDIPLDCYYFKSLPLKCLKFIPQAYRDNKFMGSKFENSGSGVYVELHGSIGSFKVYEGDWIILDKQTEQVIFCLTNDEFKKYIQFEQTLFLATGIDDKNTLSINDLMNTLIRYIRDDVDGSNKNYQEGLKKLIEAKHWFSEKGLE